MNSYIDDSPNIDWKDDSSVEALVSIMTLAENINTPK